LKTASYTVRAPVLIGARLAGASDEACRALEAFSVPLGVAFQLRDDVLGTFQVALTLGERPGEDPDEVALPDGRLLGDHKCL